MNVHLFPINTIINDPHKQTFSYQNMNLLHALRSTHDYFLSTGFLVNMLNLLCWSLSVKHRVLSWYMVLSMRKRAFGHMRTEKAQISLRIRAVWSGPSLSANRIIWYYRTYGWRANARMILWACAGWIRIWTFCACSKSLFRLTPFI